MAMLQAWEITSPCNSCLRLSNSSNRGFLVIIYHPQLNNSRVGIPLGHQCSRSNNCNHQGTQLQAMFWSPLNGKLLIPFPHQCLLLDPKLQQVPWVQLNLDSTGICFEYAKGLFNIITVWMPPPPLFFFFFFFWKGGLMPIPNSLLYLEFFKHPLYVPIRLTNNWGFS